MRVLFVMLIAALAAFANPAPFGFELGKATYSEVTAKYPATQKGTNAHSQGKVIAVSGSNFELDGLQGDVTFTFDANDKLIYVGLVFNKDKFSDLFSSLSKYKVIKKVVPFVGNKYAEFKDGDCKIILDAPHLSFSMDLYYITSEFADKIQNAQNQQEKSRKSKQDSML